MSGKRWGLTLDEYKALVMVAFINDNVSSFQRGGSLPSNVSVYLAFQEMSRTSTSWWKRPICTWSGDVQHVSETWQPPKSSAVSCIFLIAALAPPAGLTVNSIMFSVSFLFYFKCLTKTGESAECVHFSQRQSFFFPTFSSHVLKADIQPFTTSTTSPHVLLWH